MDMIYNLIPLQNDELLYSYFARLALANGFFSFNDFMRCLHGLEVTTAGDKLSNRYDSFANLSEPFSRINNVDMVKLFQSTTIYPLVAPLSKKSQQMAIIARCFYPEESFGSLLTIPKSLIHELKICEECAKEMIQEHGYFWYKRCHNLPFVSRCVKHGCKLIQFNGTKGKEMFISRENDENKRNEEYRNFFESHFTEYEAPSHPDFDQFIVDFLNKGFDISSKELIHYTTKHNKKTIEEIKKVFYDLGLEKMWRPGSIKSILQRNETRRSYEVGFLLILLYAIFEKVERIKPEYDNEEVVDFFANSKGFDVYKPYSSTIIEMQHKKCGTRFITTPYGFLNGFSCPRCLSKHSEKDIFLHLMRSGSYDEYTLISEYNPKGKVVLKHETCGKEINVTPKSFIYGPRRCKCDNHRMRFAQAQKAIKDKKLKLISFTKYDEPAVLECEKCHQRFSVDKFCNILKHPHCRICDNYVALPRDLEEVRKQIRDLVGDEYTIVSKDYYGCHKKIIMRHNKCGTEFPVSIHNFISGSRCPNCLTKMKKSEFDAFVNEVSKGKYKVLNADANGVKLIINTTTQEIVRMKKRTVLQELTRPTPSKILPLEEKGTFERTSTVFQIHEYIYNNYSKDDVIFFSEISKEFGITNASNTIQRMLTNNTIKRLGNDMYAYVDSNIPPEKIIEQMYILRHGHRIGFIYGRQLAYELGLISKKPNYLMIMTNNTTVRRLITRQGIKLKLNPCYMEITDENWEYIQMASLVTNGVFFGFDPIPFVAQFLKEKELDYMFLNRYFNTESSVKTYIKKMGEYYHDKDK